MRSLNISSFNSEVGKLKIIWYENTILHISLPNEENPEAWLKKFYPGLNFMYTANNSYITNELEEYFQGTRQLFKMNLSFIGTEFQKKVWNQLLQIPYGEVVTYKKIADKLGYNKGYQAIGQAISKNPLPILVPCHRVIGSNGQLTGYRGGLPLKRYLLELERKNVININKR